MQKPYHHLTHSYAVLIIAYSPMEVTVEKMAFLVSTICEKRMRIRKKDRKLAVSWLLSICAFNTQ